MESKILKDAGVQDIQAAISLINKALKDGDNALLEMGVMQMVQGYGLVLAEQIYKSLLSPEREGRLR